MSSTNKTTNYELTQFLATDVPSWLVDYNGDMSKIDTQMHANAVAAEAASTAASTAGNKADAAVADVAALESVIETPNTGVLARMSSAENDINTIQSLIGNGEPTTQDKTIIGAINELASEIPGGNVAADDVSYDNTTSGLVAVNVQGAIDEIQNEIENFAPEVTHKRIISIGDSYASQYASADPDTNYNKVLENMFGNDVDFYKVAEAGTGFAAQGLDGHTALTLLQSEEGSIPNHNTITDVIITVGVNDTVDNIYESAKTAIVTFINYIHTNYPNARILYGFIGNFMSESDAGHSLARKTLLLKGVPEFYDIFEKNGAIVMRGAEFPMHDARNCLSNNTTHPNARGAEAIARFIYTWYYKGFAKYQTHYDYSDQTTGAHIIADINGEDTYVEVVAWPAGTTGTATYIDTILALPSDFPVRGDGNYDYPVYQPLALQVSGQDYRWVIALIEDKEIQIAVGASVTYVGSTKLCIHMNTMYA